MSESNAPLAAILGCAGPRLTDAERALFAAVRPLGFILFRRNVHTPDQVRALVDDLRAVAGHDDALVLIDQEGGRVRRLGPPHWPETPPQGVFVPVYRRNPAAGCEAVRLNARLIAHDLNALGIDVDCLPLLDVPDPDGHDIIGDRAFGDQPDEVADLGRACIEGLLAGGCLPVIKHLPGHGRARADSHESLPIVEADRGDLDRVDFAPFRAHADAGLGMTAHVVYQAFDPMRPATLSPVVIEQAIRGRIGFDGLLMTDDLSMKALEGDYTARARDSLDAGCDVVLHCNGDMAEMQAVVEGCRPLDDAGRRRLDRARACLRAPDPFDPAAARTRLAELLTP